MKEIIGTLSVAGKGIVAENSQRSYTHWTWEPWTILYDILVIKNIMEIKIKEAFTCLENRKYITEKNGVSTEK